VSALIVVAAVVALIAVFLTLYGVVWLLDQVPAVHRWWAEWMPEP
jgi:hypothetical protein